MAVEEPESSLGEVRIVTWPPPLAISTRPCPKIKKYPNTAVKPASARIVPASTHFPSLDRRRRRAAGCSATTGADEMTGLNDTPPPPPATPELPTPPEFPVAGSGRTASGIAGAIVAVGVAAGPNRIGPTNGSAAGRNPSNGSSSIGSAKIPNRASSSRFWSGSFNTPQAWRIRRTASCHDASSTCPRYEFSRWAAVR